VRTCSLAFAAVLLGTACSGSDGTGPNPSPRPTASAGMDQTVTLGETAHLDGSQSVSPGGGQLSFTWTLLSRPAGSAAVLGSPQAATTSFVVDVAGAYTAELRVTSSAGSAADTVVVHSNRPPVADAGVDSDVTTSDTVQLNGSRSTDADGNTLTYAWSLIVSPTGSTAALISATSVQPSVVVDRSGTYRLVLQVSDGYAMDADTVTLQASFSFTEISTAGSYTCGVTTTGRLYCWGAGALGYGSQTNPFPTSTRPHRVTSSEIFRDVSTGGYSTNYFACGVTESGKGYCWGANAFGQLGAGTRSETERTPVAVSGNLSFRRISAGGYAHACGVTTTGGAYCWGNNGTGGLGNGSKLSSSTPVPVSGGLNFQDVVVLNASSCGLTTGGDLYCWGGAPDLLGTGEISADHPTPVQVGQGRTWAYLSGTTGGVSQAVCAVTVDAEGFCWGFNDFGKLGNGRMVNCYDGSGPCERVPVPVQGGAQWKAISPGAAHSCGLSTTGQAYCWGLADHGQLGTEVSTVCTAVGFPPACSFAPVPVATELRFTSISASAGTTCALTTDRDAYCWGANDGGQLGDGTRTERRSPTKVTAP
jgi:alpha-tubulin suppressor-like RCC1 family protein